MPYIELNMEHVIGLPHGVNMVTALQCIIELHETFHTDRSTFVAGYLAVID